MTNCLLKQPRKHLQSVAALVTRFEMLENAPCNIIVNENFHLFIDWRLCSQRVWGAPQNVFAILFPSFTKTTKSICRFFGIQGDNRKRFCFSSGVEDICCACDTIKQNNKRTLFTQTAFFCGSVDQFFTFLLTETMAEVEENFETFEEPAPAVVETAAVDDGLALAQPSEVPDVKLFGRWSCDDVHVSDMSLAVSDTH